MGVGDDTEGSPRALTVLGWLPAIYLVAYVLRHHAGPFTPRVWHATMSGSQHLATAFGQLAMRAELAYRRAVDKSSLT